MRKTVLTAACAALIGLGSIAAASAQTGTVNAAGNAPGMTATDSGMNSMNKMKKKKMKKMKMKKGMMNEGGMEKKM